MTDGLRKSHLRKAPQVGLSEVGLPDIYQNCHRDLFKPYMDLSKQNYEIVIAVTLIC